jgi:hypothetical protein
MQKKFKVVTAILLITLAVSASYVIFNATAEPEGSYHSLTIIYRDGTRRPLSGGLNIGDLSVFDKENQDKEVREIEIKTHTIATYTDAITGYAVSGSYMIRVYDSSSMTPVATVSTEYIAFSTGNVPSGQNVVAHTKTLSMSELGNAYASWQDNEDYWLVIESAGVTVTLTFASGKQTPVTMIPQQLAWNFGYASSEQFHSLSVSWSSTPTYGSTSTATINIRIFSDNGEVTSPDVCVYINGATFYGNSITQLYVGQYAISWYSPLAGYYVTFSNWDTQGSVSVANTWSEETTMTVNGDGTLYLYIYSYVF